jgi:hypothetical protein
MRMVPSWLAGSWRRWRRLHAALRAGSVPCPRKQRARKDEPRTMMRMVSSVFMSVTVMMELAGLALAAESTLEAKA